MFHITAARLDRGLSEPHYTRLLEEVAPDTRQRISRFRFREDALRSLTGELLARSMASSALGLPPRRIELVRGPYGKPEVAGAPSFHFNVSHAGDWIVCAAASSPVGVDVERMGDVASGLPEAILSPEERRMWDAAPAAARPDLFYAFWTTKESFVKWLGSGLSTDPKRVTVIDPLGGGEVLLDEERQPCLIYRWQLDRLHPLAVCSAASPAPQALTRTSAADWLENYPPVG